MNDKEFRGFSDADSMINFLDIKESNSEWLEDVPIEQCSFEAITDISRLPSTASEADFETVQKGTQLFLCVPNKEKPIPIRDCAMQSIYDRVRARCGFTSALPVDRRAEWLTEAAKLINVNVRSKKQTESKKGMISIVDNKVSCFLSGNGTGNDYVIHNSTDLLVNTRDAVDQIGDTLHFLGYFTYTGIDANWTINKEINLDDDPFSTYFLQLHVSTSDIGLGAVSIGGRITDGMETMIPLGSVDKILHKKHTTKEDILTAIDSVEKCIDSTKDDMERLKDIVIDYPLPCLRRVIGELKLPLKVSFQIIQNYKDTYGTGKQNCYVLYLVLCQIIGKMRNTEPEQFSYHNQNERNVLKALSKKIWEKNDYPEVDE